MRANLYTFNFKKICFATEMLVLCVIFCICIEGLNYVLVDDSNSYTRIAIHELYNQDDNIDILFLGSSHCYRSFDTKITDKYFGGNTFNAGSSSQALDGSYTLLVETGKNNILNRVFLELYYDAVKEQYSERTELTSTYIISDYLHPSVNKYSYILNASPKEYWINGLWPARRNWKNIFSGKNIAYNLSKKADSSYLNYEYIDYGWEYYDGKGFVANTGLINLSDYRNTEYEPISEKQISEDNKKMLIKIIEYCKKHDIELVVVVAPMPQFRLKRIGNYDLYIEQINDILEPYNIEYFDFNLCKEGFVDEEHFMDDHHLNRQGAEKFSTIFSKFFSGENEKRDLFYFSWEKKMQSVK